LILGNSGRTSTGGMIIGGGLAGYGLGNLFM